MRTSLMRWLRHLWADAAHVRRVLDPVALARLTEQVRASERTHSGEIRLCIEPGLDGAALWQGQTPHQRALALFSQLRVWDTEANNGVLIYLLWADHAIEIVADRGLAQRVPQAQWQAMLADMRTAFRAGQFEAGLQHAVAAVDAQLRAHFPLAEGDRNPNELPDLPVILRG